MKQSWKFQTRLLSNEQVPSTKFQQAMGKNHFFWNLIQLIPLILQPFKDIL